MDEIPECGPTPRLLAKSVRNRKPRLLAAFTAASEKGSRTGTLASPREPRRKPNRLSGGVPPSQSPYWGHRVTGLIAFIRDRDRPLSDLDAARRWLSAYEDCTGKLGVLGSVHGQRMRLCPGAQPRLLGRKRQLRRPHRRLRACPAPGLPDRRQLRRARLPERPPSRRARAAGQAARKARGRHTTSPPVRTPAVAPSPPSAHTSGSQVPRSARGGRPRGLSQYEGCLQNRGAEGLRLHPASARPEGASSAGRRKALNPRRLPSRRDQRARTAVRGCPPACRRRSARRVAYVRASS
jgi:hypothetical protein